jgi:hypothetical protein
MEAGRKFFSLRTVQVIYLLSFREWAQRVKPTDGLIKKVN